MIENSWEKEKKPRRKGLGDKGGKEDQKNVFGFLFKEVAKKYQRA